MTPATIYRVWQGNVMRWHHNPDYRLRNSGDCNQAHQCRTGQLLAMLFPDATADEFRQALLHDVPESWTGDPSYDAKKMEVVKSAHDWAETDTALRLGLPAEKSPCVDLCDNLDAILFAASRAPDLMKRADWQAHIHATIENAIFLGVGVKVSNILWDEAGIK